MAERSLKERVKILEQKVESLEALPAKVDGLTNDLREFRLEFSQFRDETRGEFSAVRREMGELYELSSKQMLDLGDRIMTQVRLLHEDVITRITVLGEGRERDA